MHFDVQNYRACRINMYNFLILNAILDVHLLSLFFFTLYSSYYMHQH